LVEQIKLNQPNLPEKQEILEGWYKIKAAETFGIVTRRELAKLLIQKGLARDIEQASTIVSERLEGITDANVVSLETFHRIFIQAIFRSSLIEVIY